MKKDIDISALTEEQLLEERVCDLPLSIEGTWLEECVAQFYAELDAKGIVFKPACYLADEWLTPDGEPVIGVPFFLAHPALMKLEKKIMLDVEGGTKEWCMMLLRHEAGHAMNYAYRLYRKKRWQKIFGTFSKEYSDTYRFRPYSRNFVRHLEDYYAQYHPDEDFAETFAVWLTSGEEWREKYKGWKAMRKLNYVDELMNQIKELEPPVKKGKKYWEASKLKATLKNFYRKKRNYHEEDFPDFHDVNLKEIFVEKSEETKGLPPASEVFKKYRKEILLSVSTWTGEKKHVINDLVKRVSSRCRELKLVQRDPEPVVVLKITAYITTLITNYVHTGQFRGENAKKT